MKANGSPDDAEPICAFGDSHFALPGRRGGVESLLLCLRSLDVP